MPRPQLAPGRYVDLPGRGRTFVRELAGPENAPTVVLLHGWTATGGVNWATAMPDLARHYRVIAIDHRGHGRGIADDTRFSLSVCADDAAAMMDALGIKNAIVAGYSMGGPIAQLLARRHPEKVAGLVLCATAARFPASAPAAVPLDAVSRVVGGLQRISGRHLLPLAESKAYARLGALDEFARHDLRQIYEAGTALARFDSRPWLPDINLPAASVVTTHDHLVPLRLQRELAVLAGARMFRVSSLAGHFCCAFGGEWVRQLGAAVADVEIRAPQLWRGGPTQSDRGANGRGVA